MNKEFLSFCEALTEKIKGSYESGVTLEEAERLAAEFLHAQLVVSKELQALDLDARMKKSGLKAVKAAIYLEAATKSDKKPSDVMLNAIVDTSELATGEQDRLDEAEVNRDALERYYSIFREAHIFYRGVSRGTFA